MEANKDSRAKMNGAITLLRTTNNRQRKTHQKMEENKDSRVKLNGAITLLRTTNNGKRTTNRSSVIGHPSSKQTMEEKRETDMSHEDNSWGTKLPVLSAGCVIGFVVLACLALVVTVVKMMFTM